MGRGGLRPRTRVLERWGTGVVVTVFTLTTLPFLGALLGMGIGARLEIFERGRAGRLWGVRGRGVVILPVPRLVAKVQARAAAMIAGLLALIAKSVTWTSHR